MLCLLRDEDGTFRETAVRLREHRAWRRVWQLPSVPDYTTLYRFRKRLDDTTINQALGAAARRLETVGPRRRRRARVAVEATGLAQGAVSGRKGKRDAPAFLFYSSIPKSRSF